MGHAHASHASRANHASRVSRVTVTDTATNVDHAGSVKSATTATDPTVIATSVHHALHVTAAARVREGMHCLLPLLTSQVSTKTTHSLILKPSHPHSHLITTEFLLSLTTRD